MKNIVLEKKKKQYRSGSWETAHVWQLPHHCHMNPFGVQGCPASYSMEWLQYRLCNYWSNRWWDNFIFVGLTVSRDIIFYKIIYLTPCSRVLQKLTVAQLVNKSAALNRTLWFITVFKRACPFITLQPQVAGGPHLVSCPRLLIHHIHSYSPYIQICWQTKIPHPGAEKGWVKWATVQGLIPAPAMLQIFLKSNRCPTSWTLQRTATRSDNFMAVGVKHSWTDIFHILIFWAGITLVNLYTQFHVSAYTAVIRCLWM